jgi:DNA-directed RNA polymerases I and III subunit RPAC1
MWVLILRFTPSATNMLIAVVNIESEGPYAPERLLPEAIKVMREKIAKIKKAAEALVDGGEAGGVGEDVDMADA